MKAMRWLTVLSFLTLAASLNLARSDPVFVERMEDGPGNRWSIVSTLEPPQLRFHQQSEMPGLHFKSVAVEEYIQSHEYAWAEWNVGSQPFELSWEVYLEEALEQQWFYPGVAVGISSAPPGEMGEEDIAITIGVHMGGLTAAVRQGGFYDLHTEGRSAFSNFRDRILSDLINASGGGIASVGWPMKHPSGNRLQFRIHRAEGGTVRFTILWPDLPGQRGKPYWSGQWYMPEEVANVPLRYICIKRMPVLKSHISYPGFVMQGVVQNIQGRLLHAAPEPVVHGFSSPNAVLSGGVDLTLSGENFQEGCRVTVADKQAGDVRLLSDGELTCTLPDLSPGQRHRLSVINPDGLTAYLKEGLPYGRLLEQVRPREVLPTGGEVVTVRGAGFEDSTIFRFGGRRAEILKVEPTCARLRVPAGEVGFADVVAHTGDEPFMGMPPFGYAPHPYLFFHADELSGLREKFAAPMFRHYRSRLLQEADECLKGEVGGDFNASVNARMVLSISYALTEENGYREKLMEWARRAWLATQYTDFHMMSVSGMSVAYDVLFRELSPEDRAAFQDHLDRMLEGYFRARDSWFMGGSFNFSNTVPVGNCGGMLAGLALMHSTPSAGEAIDIAARKAKLYPDMCISPDGGCREGVQYWDYGTSFHLILAHALKHATGNDRGLLDHPHLERNVNFIRTTLGGHGGQFAFNDTRDPWLGGYAVCADLGSRYDQPLMLWVADLCAAGGEKTRARDIWAPFAFLWRSDQPSPQEFPGVPTLAWLNDMQWGAMRSDGTFTPGLVVGVKGSRGPPTHHKQRDLGSYVVHANGEAYLVDPGYYEPESTDHTLPLVDGRGPGVTGSSIAEGWERGSWRHMTVDSTDGYGEAAERMRRLIVMYGEDRVVVLDDILPVDGKPVTITAQYQTGWPPRIDNEANHQMIVRGQKGSLALCCLGHTLQFQAEDRQFKSAWRWDKISEDGPGDWHSVTGTYTVNPDRPLITVLQPARGDSEPAAPPQCSFADGRIEVTFADGIVVQFETKEGAWAFVRP